MRLRTHGERAVNRAIRFRVGKCRLCTKPSEVGKDTARTVADVLVGAVRGIKEVRGAAVANAAKAPGKKAAKKKPAKKPARKSAKKTTRRALKK